MKKLFAVLISSAALVTAGHAMAQGSTGDATSSSGSSMSNDQSGDHMAKKSKKHKRTHKKSKSNAESNATKSMGTETDNSVQNKKNP
jgi:hypothetical protein